MPRIRRTRDYGLVPPPHDAAVPSSTVVPSIPAPATPATTPSVDAQLSSHIFSVSAGLVGVCLTVIGLFRILVRSQHVDTIADNLLALNAVLLLTACGMAYLALRAHATLRARFERAADIAFLTGITAMVGTGLLLAYEIV